jgi:putative SOS response-associated peptidase YedK
MCGRYGRRADKQRIAGWFHTHNTDVFNDEYYEINSTRLAPSYNIFPESIQPVVRLDRDTANAFSHSRSGASSLTGCCWRIQTACCLRR